ncbi:MAG: hypothetical protein EOP83_25545 [Verrucomicrobiaceae bacterium]|nr:MAG: hypothetical protein EOP83_25545 [Verrucomicrobiaceae bacterium]
MVLRSAFGRALDALVQKAIPEASDAFERVVQRYEDTGQAYHNLDHVAAVLLWVGRLGKLNPRDLATSALAVFYHDAVYDTRAKDNEERSAEFARQELGRLGVPEDGLVEIVRLILLTKTHRVEEGDLAGAVVVDADLAILQAPPEEYDRYAAAIREEYAWVPEEEYRAGRTKVLKRLMSRRLFHSPLLDEEAGRANMRREIERLRHQA